MTSLASSAIFMAVRATALADTVWVQAAPRHGWFDTVASVASGLLTIALLIGVLAMFPVALELWRKMNRLSAIAEKLHADVAPIFKYATSISENLDHVSKVIRDDVGQVHDTVTAANNRLREALALTERRVNDFGALLAVVQSEAEGIFVSTAATVHGVRRGASAFADGDGPDFASVEADGDGVEAALDDEETSYADDSDANGLDEAGDTNDDADAPRSPRIIRRSRTSR